MKKIMRILGLMAVGAVMVSCSSDGPESPVKVKALEPTAGMYDFVAAQNEAAFGMFADLYTHADGLGEADRLAYSPLSFSMVFSLVANGAEGETLNEMMKGLNCQDMTLESVNGFCAEMTRNFSGIDPAVSVAFANSVWIDKSLSVAPAFRAQVKKYYESAILSSDFSSLEAPRAINDWIYDHTNGCISEYFDPDNVLDFNTAIVNTLYFKAPWTNKFDKVNTRQEAFCDLECNSRMTPMMSSERKLDYAETDEALIASLGMGGDADSPTFTFSMIMPRETKNFRSMVAGMENAWFQDLRRHMTEREMVLKMPRFSVESSTDLDAILKKKGITLPFDNVNARFNVIDGQNWHIGGISQKVVFSADEDGAKAAAATVTEGSTGIPQTLEFNRPFVYVVTENATGVILFMGVVTSL